MKAVLHQPTFNLHRAGGVPDWEKVDESLRNVWQQLAAETSGIVTPANLFDVTTFGASALINSRLIVASHREMLSAVKRQNVGTFKAAARKKIIGLLVDNPLMLADLFDGQIADMTGTKSSLGELVDSGGDLARTILKIKTRKQIGEFSAFDISCLVGPKIANAALAGTAKVLGKEFHSSKGAKLAEAGRWAAFALADATEIAKTLAQSNAVDGNGVAPGFMSKEELWGTASYLRIKRVRDAAMVGALVGGSAVSLANLRTLKP